MTADAERCLYCGELIPEGRQVCPRCEAELGGAFDGGTLKAGDVMRLLNCERDEADLVLDTLGFQAGRYKGISLRDFRLHQLNGDLTWLLSVDKSKRKEAASILYLRKLGYTVTKG